MPKRDQLRRLLEIDRRVRAGTFPSPDQLAVELEVKRRAIFNDRAYLVDVLKAPLKFSRQHGGWYYTEPTWILPNILVTRGELLAFVLAVEAARHPLGALLHEEFHGAVEKISDAMGENVSANLEALLAHFTFAPAPVMASSDSVATRVLEVHGAIERRRVLRMRYFSARNRQTKWRRVEPHHLHNDGGEWRFFAFDRALGEMRTFNIARIEELETTAQTFVPQTTFQASEFLKTSFRHELGPRVHQIAVRFDAQQATYIREGTWHPTQSLQDDDEGGVTLRFQASGLDEIARWLLGYGAHALVLEPPELRALVRDSAAAMLALYRQEAEPQNYETPQNPHLSSSISEEWGREYLSSEWMNEQATAWVDEFFDRDQDDIGNSLMFDLIRIARHFAQQGMKPSYVAFEERENYDLNRLAFDRLRYNSLENDARLREEFAKPGNLWKIFYKSYERFATAFDGAMRQVLHQQRNGLGDKPIAPRPKPSRKITLTETEMAQVKKRDGNQCLCCGAKGRGVRLQIDHIIPYSLGGETTIDNSQTLCSVCNGQKAQNEICYLRNVTPLGEARELVLLRRAGTEAISQTITRVVNSFYRCHAVCQVHIHQRSNGQFYSQWEIELYSGNDPKWLSQHKKALVKHIQNDWGCHWVTDVKFVGVK